MTSYVRRLSHVELRMRERFYDLESNYRRYISHPRILLYIKRDLITAFREFYRLGQEDAKWEYAGCQNCFGRGYQLAPELPEEPESDKRLWFCLCERGQDLKYLYENNHMQDAQ
jgi:hypothetical protein